VINKKEKVLVLKNDKPIDNTSWYALIDEFKKKKEELDEKDKKLTEQIDLYNKLNFIFGENGAKQYVNNSIVPQLNAIIADIVDFMGIPYTIRFDNMFNTTITNYGVNVSYRSLSSGERKRVDFACIIAFIRLMKIQYPSMNLLFLDEIMNSLDINGASTLMEILKGLTNELNVNAFVIHHAQLDASMFDKIIKVQKINGFSQIEIE
jgi:DNA repair exonuclease SbcCD ATPase subunit